MLPFLKSSINKLKGYRRTGMADGHSKEAGSSTRGLSAPYELEAKLAGGDESPVNSSSSQSKRR
jgi:hypothetical protein